VILKQRVNASLPKRDAAVAGQELSEAHASGRFAWLRPVAALLLFGAAFGCLEAALSATYESSMNRRAAIIIRIASLANCSLS
jgi:hypothetical protein